MGECGGIHTFGEVLSCVFDQTVKKSAVSLVRMTREETSCDETLEVEIQRSYQKREYTRAE